jgi:type III secretion protein V
MNALNRILLLAKGRQDVVFVMFFMLITAMLVIPLPTFLIDALIVINLTISIVVLIAALYLRSVLDLSTFPAIILVSTIFRLALTVSTTRLILSNADGGKVIAGFGNFVVGNNVVVGLVIFFIVAFVQFLVVTKGAERIAEVSARFTLDAMPGKQMAIDADVRAGDIDKEEARRRRGVIDKESQFFGAMDGAMRFVKGDAIAALVVVFVNLFGGLLIGTLQKGMKLSEAIHIYSILSIGDGLVAQIPSMFIAISAGIVVTRVATDKSADLGQDITRQLAKEPRTLLLAAVILVLFAFVPGFPTTIFLIVAAMTGGAGFFMLRDRDTLAKDKVNQETARVAEIETQRVTAETTLPANKPGEIFTIIINEDLLREMEARGLAPRWTAALSQLGQKLGFDLPPVGFVPDEAVDGMKFFIEGVPTGALRGDECGDEDAVLAWMLRAVERDCSRAFDVEAAVAWLARQRERHPKLTGDVDQTVTTLLVVDFCRELLEDGLPLTQSRMILETMMRAQKYGGRVAEMVDACRLLMKRAITTRFTDSDGQVNLVICSPDAENVLRRAAEQTAGARAAPAVGEEVRKLLGQVREVEDRMAQENRPVALAVPADMRRSTRMLLGIQSSQIPVVAFSELEAGSRLRTVLVLTAQMQSFAPQQPPRPQPAAPMPPASMQAAGRAR